MLNTEGVYISGDDEEDTGLGNAYEKDDDDDEEEKPVRRVSTGSLFGVEAIKDKEEKERSKRKLTFTGSLFERMNAKTDDEKDKGKEKPKAYEEDAKTEAVEIISAEVSPTTSTDQQEQLNESTGWENETPGQAENLPEPPEMAETPVAETESPTEPGMPDLPPQDRTETHPEEPEEVDPDLLNTGLGMEGPPEPPEGPPAPPENEPDEPEDPAITTHWLASGGSGYGAGAAGASQGSTASGSFTHEDLEEAENRGRRYGTRRGLGAGLLFGWMFGRHGKKKADREHTKEMKEAHKEIKELKTEQELATERLKAVQGTQEQLRGRLTQAEAEKARVAANNTHDIKVVGKAEQETTEKAEELEDAKEKLVENSAWHRIELDPKTGRALEKPELEYGEEFARERSHEIFNEGKPDDSGGAAANIGGLATTFSMGEKASRQSSISAGAKTQAEDHEKQLKAGALLLRYASKPLIWAVAVILVVVLFAFGLLR